MPHHGAGYGAPADWHYPARRVLRLRASGRIVSALAALAARTVGRRVRIGAHVGTVTRVTGSGYVVTLAGLHHEDVTFLDD